MLKKTMTYTDYNGVERTETFMFNLTQAELAEMELTTEGGLVEMINKVVDAQDTPTIIRIFKDVIFKAYGVKSADGRQFQKSEEISRAFSQTPAYSMLFMELATDAQAASEFINGIIPEQGKNNTKVLAAKTTD